MGSLERKIEILGEASKFDVCASMASPRIVKEKKTIGSPDKIGICHSFTPDGRCISLFKVLMTNNCIFDCQYCMNNCNIKKDPVMFSPQELARAFIGLYIRNYIEGIFLSSGIWRNTTETAEKIIEALKIIREVYRFRGYMHIKILPGTNKEYIKQIMELSDRVSVNIELPTSSHMKEVSSMKNYYSDIIKCQKQIRDFIQKDLLPAGQTTQFIIGSTGETDYEIIERLHWEYKNFDIKRGYFSSFTPVRGLKLKQKRHRYATIKKRENYLYRVDWLYRRYNYNISSLLNIMNEEGMIPLHIDPKISLALNDDIFPIDVNEASYHELIRVPGIGEISARRITNLRKINQKIGNYSDLRRIGAVIEHLKPFLIVNGKYQTTLTEFVW